MPEVQRRHPDDPYVIHREASDDVDPELYSSVHLKAGVALTGMTHNLGHQVSASANVDIRNEPTFRFSGSYGVSAFLFHLLYRCPAFIPYLTINSQTIYFAHNIRKIAQPIIISHHPLHILASLLIPSKIPVRWHTGLPYFRMQFLILFCK